jgi:DNA-binding transcriptional LysR family regulator
MGLCSARMTIEARHLRSFLAIAEEGNVTRAAARLNVSQPALSRTLGQLEQRLGVRLVDRSTHHLSLTDAGRRFQPAAAEAIRTFDQALASVVSGVPPLRLGHTWASSAHTVTIVRAWNAAHPDWPVQLRRSDERTGGLAHGEVDIALIRGPVIDPTLQTSLIDEEQRVAAIPAGHRLASAVELTLAELADEPLVVNSRAGTTTPDLWPEGARPHVVADSTSTDGWLITIAAGTGIGVTPASTATLQPHPDVRYIPLRGAPLVPLLLAWPAHDPHPHIRELVRVAHRATASLRPSRTARPLTRP